MTSRTALARNFDLARNTVVQIGGGLATVTAGVIAGSIISPAGWIIPAGAGPGFLVALPIAIGGTIPIRQGLCGLQKRRCESMTRQICGTWGREFKSRRSDQ